MTLKELMEVATAADVASVFVLVFIILTAIIEVSPLKIDPWSWLARTIGRAINGEVLKKVNDLQSDIHALDERVTRIGEINDERVANAARRDILRFSDEILHSQLHSKEMYDDILRRCKDYEEYCETHPNYLNHKAEKAIERIMEKYEEHLRDNSFLN